MPKETIRGEGFDVEVMWGRDRADVQIATVIRPPATSSVGEGPASLGTLIERWTPDERFTATGLYATLDTRSAVNDLIRVLRRARDQAFGRDE